MQELFPLEWKSAFLSPNKMNTTRTYLDIRKNSYNVRGVIKKIYLPSRIPCSYCDEQGDEFESKSGHEMFVMNT